LKILDIVRNRYNRLLVMEEAGRNKRGNKTWRCVCDCGNEVIISSSDLRHNHTQSCGCLQRNRVRETCVTHGQTKTLLYSRWGRSIQRCTNSNFIYYQNYGGRGIGICEEWRDFEKFKEWAEGSGFQPHLSIERIDNDKGYFPDNCKWVTRKEQGANKRNNHWMTLMGETKTLAQWSRQLSLCQTTIRRRLKRGLSDEEALDISYRDSKMFVADEAVRPR
jgi:hypothetical protein